MKASPRGEVPKGEVPIAVEKAVAQALTDRCRLQVEELKKIADAMRRLNLNFVDAALQLGSVTPREAAEAMAAVRESMSGRKGSIVETAIRRLSDNALVSVRSSELVKPGPQLIIAHDSNSERSERVRGLRTEIMMLCESRSSANSIAVVSSGAGEGRSQLAAELAVAFAQLNQRTLLIDADLRKPSQHLLFNAQNTWGLAQALAFDENPYLQGVEGVPALSLLTAGPASPNPLDLLSSARMGRLITAWRTGFQFIIMDSPPVGQYSDGLTLAKITGRVLVVSRSQVTGHSDMKEMLRRLASTQSHILGAVINQF